MQIAPALALCAITLANTAVSTAVFAEASAPTPGTQDYCVFRNELYSFGATICVGKNRALRCDGPDPAGPTQRFRTAHWVFLQPEDPVFSQATLGEACNVPSPS
jgi:hypothetical protein